ncbi:uncharacterized protein cubi_02602 [Cryptosporidium ubiquitum]|uniref:TFIIE beta domain-containing protein n=1 Tax=Cryptosporidium ubiquitum TaxID=857276 RepID=A0A1J4MGN1_9CRYT|nr:uncharacterized protein cubi_02602 [Cryptosporidium ubiquitum]OII73390.1 hypothetical protein cubi_02602 [Cryptosporidium ubiquitum]
MSNEEKPFSYLIHKVLNILQSNATPLRRKEIHSLLYKDGVQISLESDFWTKIHLHDRVFLDQATGKYSYKSPYDKLNSEISLLAFVRQHQDGLLIDEELLKTNPSMERWIRNLMCKKAVRCLRQQQIAGRIRCKNGGLASTGSSTGTGCPLSSQRPCESCSSLKGIVLYPLTENVGIEEIKMDDDIKETWKSLIHKKGMNLEDIIRTTRGEMAVRKLLGLDKTSNCSEPTSKRRQNKSSSSNGTELKRRRIKIKNSHIFNNSDELFSFNT